METIYTEYNGLIETISTIYTNGKVVALQAVNSQLLITYWQIGQHIVEFEQGGKVKATYGKALLENLSKDLKNLHGKGFSRSNLSYMRMFFIKYPICATPSHKFQNNDIQPNEELPYLLKDTENEQSVISGTVSHKLSWSHYVELLKINDDLERSFYQQQALLENWNIRELIRQKNSSLYLRLASSKDKEGILKLAHQGQVIAQPTDILKDVYVFEFLKIAEQYHL